MSYRIVTNDDSVGEWVAKKTGGQWPLTNAVTIGLLSGATIVAGLIYHDYNKVNIFGSIACERLNKEFLWYLFYYPFVEAGCSRLSAQIDSTNYKSIRLVEKLGFTLEATLKEASPKGDILIYRMLKHECERLNYETIKPPSST